MRYIIRNKYKLKKEIMNAIKETLDEFEILKHYSWDHKIRLSIKLQNKIFKEDKIA